MEDGSGCHGHMTLTETACRSEMTGASALHSVVKRFSFELADVKEEASAAAAPEAATLAISQSNPAAFLFSQ